jgi:hypothetical protein
MPGISGQRYIKFRVPASSSGIFFYFCTRNRNIPLESAFYIQKTPSGGLMLRAMAASEQILCQIRRDGHALNNETKPYRSI